MKHYKTAAELRISQEQHEALIAVFNAMSLGVINESNFDADRAGMSIDAWANRLKPGSFDMSENIIQTQGLFDLIYDYDPPDNKDVKIAARVLERYLTTGKASWPQTIITTTEARKLIEDDWEFTANRKALTDGTVVRRLAPEVLDEIDG